MAKYPLPIIQTLFAYSGNKCAFPDCNANMVEDKSIIGEKCHIEGEKEESARYNPNMTDKERNSLDNLILLCPTHHTLIDKKPQEYTTDNLKKMKHRHELKNKNGGYHIPDDILKIVNVSINNDNYSLQRTHNLLQLYKGLSSNETKRLWRVHFKYVLNGLTFSQPISEDEKNALRVLFYDLLELKYDKDMFPELLLAFLDKVPIEIQREYTEELKPYIESIVKEGFANPYLPHLYPYLHKTEIETLNYLINNADKFDNDSFKTLMDRSNVDFGKLVKTPQYLELEHRLWKKLDSLEKEKTAKERYNIAYENIKNLINKFY
jgi:hypothetical protein